MRLMGKIALVTGGSLGIGQAVAVRFAREGARVAISGRNRSSLEETAELIQSAGGEALAIEADVSRTAEAVRTVDRVAETWGGIDVLVNNAGICNPAPFLDITEEEWDRHVAVNLKGTFIIAQRAARVMAKRGAGGTIINMSSVNGLAAEADQAHYNATKGAVNLLTMSMAVELASLGIRTNALCPGFIETRLTRPLIGNAEAIRNYLKSIPMGRYGVPEEVADAALFLASDESRYMNGHCLVIDGGQMIKLS